ncbi:MAG TPA: LysR family transcriptional regulator [Solirubrobacteraceae bacterium]|jgi:LysR family nod box-dependent transcriptional activator|nr:LysR family transcriptional regulator [Solirubrobacteraceae bacterium]
MDLGGLDLNLLVALDALLSERSVTRAAQRVGLSQPGMSNALSRLRAALGDPLLVRQGPALVPTSRAEALAEPVREALELIRGAVSTPTSFDPARDRRSLRISCSDYSVLMLIGPLVRELAADAPAMAVEVLPRLADAGRALHAGDVDLVIEPPEIMGRSDLPAARLWDDRWMCCVWEGNRRVRRTMTLEDFTSLGHLAYTMGSGSQPVALPDVALRRLGIARRIEVSVESFLLAPFLLERTELVTLVPARAEAFLRGVGAIRILEPPVELPVLVETLWWHPRATADPAHRWLRERIARVAAERIS